MRSVPDGGDSIANRYGFQVQHAETGGGEAVNPVADAFGVIDDEQYGTRSFAHRYFLKPAVKPLLLANIAGLAGSIENFVDLRIAVAPVVAVPRPGAVIPLIKHRVRRGASEEAVDHQRPLRRIVLIFRHLVDFNCQTRRLGKFAQRDAHTFEQVLLLRIRQPQRPTLFPYPTLFR